MSNFCVRIKRIKIFPRKYIQFAYTCTNLDHRPRPRRALVRHTSNFEAAASTKCTHVPNFTIDHKIKQWTEILRTKPSPSSNCKHESMIKAFHFSIQSPSDRPPVLTAKTFVCRRGLCVTTAQFCIWIKIGLFSFSRITVKSITAVNKNRVAWKAIQPAADTMATVRGLANAFFLSNLSKMILPITKNDLYFGGQNIKKDCNTFKLYVN